MSEKWTRMEIKGEEIWKCVFDNGDIIVYSIDKEDGLIDLFNMYIKEGNIKYIEELSSLNMLYLSSGFDIETVRAIMKISYRERVENGYYFIEGMFD